MMIFANGNILTLAMYRTFLFLKHSKTKCMNRISGTILHNKEYLQGTVL